MNPTTITRKEIAHMTGVSVKTVARRARKWGLEQFRSPACSRDALYFRKLTIDHMERTGLIR